MIAFFLRGIYPEVIGGMEIFYHHLIHAMSKDERVIIMTVCPLKTDDPNIQVIPVSDRIFLVRRFGLGKISIFFSCLIQILRYSNIIDVIHITTASNTGFFGAIFPLIKKITGIPYVVTFHGGGLIPWPKSSFFPSLFRSASRSIAVSSVIQKTLEERTGCKVNLILPLTPFFKSEQTAGDIRKTYGISTKAKVMVMVGSIKKIKGSKFVVESFIGLGKEYIRKNELILLLAGDGEDKNEISEIIRLQDCQETVILMGIVSNEKIHEIFGMADYYIIASEYEGTSKSLLEAMFNKLPIIASNVKGINNIVQDGQNGVLFEFNDINSFQLKLKAIINNDIYAQGLGEMAEKYFKNHFSFNHTVESYLKIFENYRKKKEKC